MSAASRRPPGRLARLLRRLETVLGADRQGRSLWVWMGPFSTVVLTFGALLVLGAANHADLTLTLPMAVVMAVFMGSLSAFYMSAASADEADARDDDGDSPPPPAPRAPQPGAVAGAVSAPQRPSAPAASLPVRQAEPEPVGAARSA